MAETVVLKEKLDKIRDVDPAMLSYNIEAAEVTGGTFWKAYTPEQIDGTEEFVVTIDPEHPEKAFMDLMQVYPPINLKGERIRKLAKALGDQWIRMSGTWATKTYYDLDNELAEGEIPEGFLNVLKKEQLENLLDFVKAVDGKLMVSVSASPGVYGTNEAPIPAWTPKEAEKLFKFAKDYGVPIQAAEFVNEPNLLENTGFPVGYTAADHARDQKIFVEWLKENYPEVMYVGPNTTGSETAVGREGPGGGIEQLMGAALATTDELMGEEPAPLDVFSYHYYNGLSERLGAVLPAGHWPAEKALSEEYLAVAPHSAKVYTKFRDKYAPGAQMWVTESGDAGGGGDTWASTFLDVPRTLNEVGTFGEITDGIIFHNTLAASDYAWLDSETHLPRPNYFAVLLFNKLMGNEVLETGEEIREGAHVFARNRKDGKEGVVYMVINNSETEPTKIVLPKKAERYTLQGKDGNKRATVMTLNGEDLVLGENDEIPEFIPVEEEAGEIELPPVSATFLVL